MPHPPPVSGAAAPLSDAALATIRTVLENARTSFGNAPTLYRLFRPGFPLTIARSLAALVNRRGVAVDLATGTGQLASILAECFDSVVATDIDPRMTEAAAPAENVRYFQAPADRTTLADAAADLITVANGIHWVETPAFRTEVDRVLRPGGVFAILKHDLARLPVGIPALDARFREVIKTYTSPSLAVHNTGFDQIQPPYIEHGRIDGEIRNQWRHEQYLGLLRTFSASETFATRHGYPPTDLIADEVHRVWGDGLREVVFPIVTRWSRKPH